MVRFFIFISFVVTLCSCKLSKFQTETIEENNIEELIALSLECINKNYGMYSYNKDSNCYPVLRQAKIDKQSCNYLHLNALYYNSYIDTSYNGKHQVAKLKIHPDFNDLSMKIKEGSTHISTLPTDICYKLVGDQDKLKGTYEFSKPIKLKNTTDDRKFYSLWVSIWGFTNTPSYSFIFERLEDGDFIITEHYFRDDCEKVSLLDPTYDFIPN